MTTTQPNTAHIHQLRTWIVSRLTARLQFAHDCKTKDYAIKKDDKAAMTPTIPKDMVVVAEVEGVPVTGGGVPVALPDDDGEAVSSLVGAACGGAEIGGDGVGITVSAVATGAVEFVLTPTSSQSKAQPLIKSAVS
jgi:hypothetical protein